MKFTLFGKRKKREQERWSIRTMFGPNLNFASTEAYKLLRANLMFSLPDEGRGRVIGVTSSVQSEGKSSTSCNIAYALAEAGTKVLLLDCDLRRPSVASKLNIARTPGLTNLLVAKGDYREMICHSAAAPNLDVLPSGDRAPNPSELLGSNRMARLINELTSQYDYIVVDLPPVNVVSDAIAISKLLDGVVMVVRKGVSEQRMLEEALRQLKLVDVRILGFAFRDSNTSGKTYKRYSNYKYKYKYYSDYQRG